MKKMKKAAARKPGSAPLSQGAVYTWLAAF
jgi:hypothetical protein